MTLKDRRIVVIDDTEAIRAFLRISLEGQGAIFSEAANATQGIDLCHKMKPDVVVLDLGLPDRDGLEVLPEITLEAEDDYSPAVIVLTVRRGQEIVNQALGMGAKAYVTKPFMMEDLLEVIESHVPERRRA